MPRHASRRCCKPNPPRRADTRKSCSEVNEPRVPDWNSASMVYAIERPHLQHAEPAPERNCFVENWVHVLCEKVDRVIVTFDRFKILERAPPEFLQYCQPVRSGRVRVVPFSFEYS